MGLYFSRAEKRKDENIQVVRVNNEEMAVVENEGLEVDICSDNPSSLFPCSLCKKSFKHRNHLRRHLKISHKCTLEDITPKKQYMCTMCSKSYDRKQHLIRHMEKHSKLCDIIVVPSHKTKKKSKSSVNNRRAAINEP